MSKIFERVILHVGWDKTGSTAVQYFFDLNRESIEKNFSLYYPLGRWHAFLGSMVSSDPVSYVDNKNVGLTDKEEIERRDERLRSQFEGFIDSKNPGGTLVLSYEGFVSLPNDALVRLREYLAQFSDEILVLAYVRPLFSYARSAISQRAKQGQPISPDGSLPRNRYKDILKKFFSVFGREAVHVHCFSPSELVGRDVLLDFMSFCGVEESNFREKYRIPSRQNESVKGPAVLFSESLREALKARNCGYTVSEYGGLIGRNLSSCVGPGIYLAEDKCAELLKLASEDIEFLKENYDIDLIDRKPNKKEGETSWQTIIPSLADSIADAVGIALTGTEKMSDSSRSYRGYIAPCDVGREISCEEKIKVKVVLRNGSDQDWHIDESSGPKMSYHWEKLGEYVVFDGVRTLIPCDSIKRDEEKELYVDVVAPSSPGDYTLIISAVKEGVCWFEKAGCHPAYLKFSVSE